MRTCSAALTAAVLTTLFFASSAFARDRSAMNGTWTLVPAMSDFAGRPVLQTGTVTISQNNATIHTGKGLKSKTRWDRGVLK